MAYQPKTESEVRIGLEGLPGGTLIGSQPVFMRPRDDDGNVPDPDDRPPPPPPPPREPVSAPDFAFQLRPCLEDFSFPPGIPVPPGYSFVTAVTDAVRSIAGQQADIRHSCSDGSSRIGVWLFPSGDPVVNAARDRGTRLLNPIRGGEAFAVFVSTSFIKAVAQQLFDAAPKRTDHNGQPATNGPVHITGHDVVLQFPDKIITKIRGFDTSPWPDVSFEIRVTDTLRISGSAVDVETDTDLDSDVGIFVALGIFLLPLSPLAGLGFLVEAAIIGSLDPDDRDAAAGAVVAQHIPRDIFLRGGIKFVPVYQRVVVTTPGVVAGGGLLVVPRDPAVSIIGPRSITVTAGETKVTKSYQANTRDLRQQIQFSWTGAGTASNAGAKVTSITFDVAGLAVGSSTLREVRLSARDPDNLTATASVMVRIFRTDPDEVDTNLPPICNVRPWLPQCNPPDI